MFCQWKLLQGCIIVVYQTQWQSWLLVTQIIGTALHKVFTQTRCTRIPLIATRFIICPAFFGVLSWSNDSFFTRYVINFINKPSNFAPWCIVMCQMTMHFQFFIKERWIYIYTGSDFLPRFSNCHLEFGKIAAAAVVAVVVAGIVRTRTLRDQLCLLMRYIVICGQ